MSWLPRFPVLLALVLVALACDGGEAEPEATVASDLDPVAVVREVLVAVDEGRFEDTAPLTDASQAGLLTLAEGADANEVVQALEDGGEVVAANFWSGFAQTLDPEFDPDSLDLEEGERLTEDGSQFAIVMATLPDGEARSYVLRRDGAWKIDLMGTFGSVLAERLIPPVEALLSSANANAGVVLAHLREAAPSLRVAAESPTLPPASHQSLLTLIERITR